MDKTEYKITKTFSHKISANYQSLDFSTTLSTSFMIGSADELVAASDKVFAQAKALTMADIDANQDLITELLNKKH